MTIHIHDVPVELISCIFVFMLCSAPPSFPIVLCRVCKRWSEIAKRIPQIWPPMILGYGFPWTLAAVKRSRQLPLDITLVADGNMPISLLRSEISALTQLHRIRTLVSIGSHLTTSYRRIGLLDADAPLLETLKICPAENSRPQYIRDNLLRPSLPRLTHLELTRTELTPMFSALTFSLTHLHLTFCIVWRSTKEMLTTLAGLPRLQSFTWKRDPLTLKLEILARSQPKAQRVEMLKLSHLEMDDEFELIKDFMSCITLSPSCSVLLFPRIDNAITIGLIPAIDDIILPHFTGLFPRDSHHLESGSTDLQVLGDKDRYAFTVRWSRPGLEHVNQVIFELCLNARYSFVEHQVPILCHLLGQWPGAASPITRLTLLHSEICADAQTWRNLFSNLDHLVDLTTGGAAAETLYAALSAETEQLPHLTALTLCDVELSVIEYQVYIREMERRRQLFNVGSRVPRKISFVNCIIMGERLRQMDLTLREVADGEEETQGEEATHHP